MYVIDGKGYIDRDELLMAVDSSMRDNPHLDAKLRVNHNNEHRHIWRMIYDMPLSDVRPVVHAKWIFGKTLDHEWMKCSNCLKSQTPTGVFAYCPNCGATMDL